MMSTCCKCDARANELARKCHMRTEDVRVPLHKPGACGAVTVKIQVAFKDAFLESSRSFPESKRTSCVCHFPRRVEEFYIQIKMWIKWLRTCNVEKTDEPTRSDIRGIVVVSVCDFRTAMIITPVSSCCASFIVFCLCVCCDMDSRDWNKRNISPTL